MFTRRDEAGLTVTELAMTLVIFTIVTFGMLTFLDSTTKVSRRATLSVRAEQNAQLAMRTIDADLRAANPITGTANPVTGAVCAGGYRQCVTFEIPRVTTYGESCPKTVMHYALSGTELTQTFTDYDAACTATRSVSDRKVLSDMVAGAPVFTYYNSAGTVLNPANSTDLAKIPLSPKKGGTASIGVSLAYRYDSQAPSAAISSVVSLRNNR